MPRSSRFLGIGSVASRVYLTVVAGLLFWAVAPRIVGWTPVVVRTGSMQPAVRPGDVLLVQHVASAAVRPGQIVLAANPANPSQLLSHRVVKVDPDGSLVTRGDANATDDSTPVAPRQLKGVARLRVPFIGRPAVWWWEGQRNRTLAWLAVSSLAVLLAGTQAARRERRRPAETRVGRHRLPRGRTPWAAVG